MSAPSPKPLNEALPPRLTAGDALSFAVTTRLAAGTFLFFVLTLLRKAPVRQRIGWVGDAPNVAVDSTGLATFTVPSAATALWAPGTYRWQAFSYDGTSRDQLAEGEIRVAADPNGALPPDERSQDERVLDQINALLEGKSLDDVQRYKIGTRELDKIPHLDLLRWKGVYEARVRNARRARGEKVPSRTVGIVFGGRP